MIDSSYAPPSYAATEVSAVRVPGSMTGGILVVRKKMAVTWMGSYSVSGFTRNLWPKDGE